MRKLKEWINIQVVNNPGKVVILFILLFNVVFFLVSAVIIGNFSLTGTEKMSFLEAAFCTVTMILDAGCIQYVISDIGASSVVVVVTCLCIVFVGMITFTGAVIGYVTNYISNFIDNNQSGSRKLNISNHSVILNWNTRASEIINDMLYCDDKQTTVVLVSSNKESIEKEIKERLDDTIAKENAAVLKKCTNMGFLKKYLYILKHSFNKKITVVVREGDIFSLKQLTDISIEKAKMIIILGNDINNSVCKYETQANIEEKEKGNSITVKTLMQVADITSANYSFDNQKIVVEVTDDWTAQLVEKIREYKQVEGKCNIVAVRVNQILGHILSQFSLMPELNLAYRELFSNKGATFYTKEWYGEDECEYIKSYFNNHKHALPLTSMKNNKSSYFYYAADSEHDIDKETAVENSDYIVDLNKDYWIERKNIVILGHNSRCKDIMDGFSAFNCEWGYKNSEDKIVRVVVVDDQQHLEKMNYYRDYPFVIETVAAEIFDKQLICSTIESFVDSNKEDTSILILSDDSAPSDSVDASALANLIYVQDIINNKKLTEDSFTEGKIDIIVEIINPKHYDVVSSYSVNNVVISNRYISKMITQIAEKEALFDFYTDILTYDTEEDGAYESKEVYIKKVSRFFNEVPKKTTADKLIRAVYNASIDVSLPAEKRNPAIVLGYVKLNGEIVLFNGDHSQVIVDLSLEDKLIVFSNH